MRAHAKLIATAGGVGLLVVMLTVLVAGCGGTATAGGPADTAPDLSGATLAGADVSLSEYRGKPLVLAFMASW